MFIGEKAEKKIKINKIVWCEIWLNSMGLDIFLFKRKRENDDGTRMKAAIKKKKKESLKMKIIEFIDLNLKIILINRLSSLKYLSPIS